MDFALMTDDNIIPFLERRKLVSLSSEGMYLLFALFKEYAKDILNNSNEIHPSEFHNLKTVVTDVTVHNYLFSLFSLKDKGKLTSSFSILFKENEELSTFLWKKHLVLEQVEMLNVWHAAHNLPALNFKQILAESYSFYMKLFYTHNMS